MAKVKKSIVINATVEKVYDYLVDQQNQINWMPSLVDLWDISEKGEGQNFKWKYKMSGVMLEGETAVIETVPNKRIGTKTKGAVSSEWLLVFDATDEGTMLEMNIDYTVPIPVLGKVAERIILKRNEREAVSALENIKEIMES